MNPGFIKQIRSEEVLFLARKHPKAFVLLTFIAHRARRENGHIDGLTIGQCHVGDWENMGLTRKEYRTAKDVLCTLKIIKIVETCRNRKKGATGRATIGTLVELCDSRIYDINSEEEGHRKGQRGATEGPPKGHEQEGIRSTSNEVQQQEDAQTAARPRTTDPLNFDFTIFQFVGITENDRQQWKTIYSHIVLDVELARATEWVKANPSRSNKKLWRKFLTTWFGKANEKAENKKAYSYASNGNSTDRRTKDINGVPVENIHAGRF